MRKHKIILLFVTIFSAIGLQNCQVCDNCEVTPAPKQVSIVNNKNQNLIFGTSAVYNPDDIVIKNEFGEVVEFFTNTNNQSIDFTFSITSKKYFVILNASETEEISFVYGKEKQIDCCNEFDVTTSTSVNNKVVANDDAITIVK